MTTLPAPRAPAAPSPIDAASEAVEHTRRRLFPVQPERWLVLGFLAFLDQCGRGGGGFPGGGGDGGGGGGGEGFDFAEVAAWLSSHVGLIVIVTVAALALVVAFLALVLWLGSRGVFMYLDAVVTGRAEVKRPWREHAEAAGSLFVWRFALALGTLLVVMLLIAGALAVVLVAVRGGAPSGALVLGLLLGLLLILLPLGLVSLLASVALRDFVAPLQLHRRCACGEAARALVVLVRAHPGAFALYLLLKLVFSILAGVALLLLCCLTCCLAIVPVVSQALLQPVWHFERSWSVCLLRQMGHDLFASFPGASPASTAPPAGDRHA